MPAIESVDGVLTAFGGFITEEVAATAIALGGLRTLAYQVESFLNANPDADETHLVGVGVPDVGWLIRVDGAAGANAYTQQLAPGGPTVQRLTQQLIVSIDTAWEEEFRRRLARAHGFEDKNVVRADFFADLRRLRNDVVHHRGIATERGAGRCTTFLRKFVAGQPIHLDDRDLLNVRFMVPWADLSRRPTLET